MTYSHHFKECFHYPKELILISSSLNLFHVNRKLATATENILQVSLPTVAELNPLSRALIIISQFAALVSEEVMWLPREARVRGQSSEARKSVRSGPMRTNTPTPTCPRFGGRKGYMLKMLKKSRIERRYPTIFNFSSRAIYPKNKYVKMQNFCPRAIRSYGKELGC